MQFYRDAIFNFLNQNESIIREQLAIEKEFVRGLMGKINNLSVTVETLESQLKHYTFMAAYSDFAGEELRDIRNQYGVSLTAWRHLENRIVADYEQFLDVGSKGPYGPLNEVRHICLAIDKDPVFVRELVLLFIKKETSCRSGMNIRLTGDAPYPVLDLEPTIRAQISERLGPIAVENMKM